MTAVAVSFMIIAFLFALCMSLRRVLHQLQLASYQFPGYFKAVSAPRRQLPFVAAFVCMIAFEFITALYNSLAGYILAGALFVILGVCTLPRPEKKKFVFTGRVNRLVVTLFVISAAFCAYMLSFNDARLLCVACFAYYVLGVEAVFVAACINYPIEKLIQAHFINDAKRKLKAMPDTLVIGVTGSYGKTGVKNYLYALLSEEYNAFMTPKSFNTPMGIVRAVREGMRPTNDVFICEMGARHVGDIAEVCAIAEPNWGVITSIGEQHLETFKTFENIKKTKLELARAVYSDKNKNAKLFINGDSVGDAKTLYKNAITYGLGEQNDCRATDITSDENGTSFTFNRNGTKTRFTTELLGIHSVINITGALAVAAEAGIPPESLYARVRRLNPVKHRLELIKRGNDIIIDDAFNSNPEGASAALDTLSSFSGTRIFITPGMVELGARQAELNKELGAHAKDCCDYALLVGRVNSDAIKKGLIDAGFNTERIFTFNTFQSAMEKANAVNTAGGRRVILIENDLPDNY